MTIPFVIENSGRGERSYDITVGSGLLDNAYEYMNLARKVFIVTDSGVPKEYAEKIREMVRRQQGKLEGTGLDKTLPPMPDEQEETSEEETEDYSG